GGGGGGGAAQSVGSCISPDGRTEAFIQNYNVAIRPAREMGARQGGAGRGGRGGRGTNPATSAAAQTLLSSDGSEGDAYQLMSIRWSPDSKKLVAYRRRPGYNRLVHYVLTSPPDQLQPKDTSIFYRKPGDAVDVVQPALFDVEA